MIVVTSLPHVRLLTTASTGSRAEAVHPQPVESDWIYGMDHGMSPLPVLSGMVI